MCDVDYGDRADVYNESRPRARKAHTCTECGLPILAGTIYRRIESLFDGRWWSYCAHPECDELNRFIALDVCGQEVAFIDGGLRENVREHMTDADHGREVLRMWRDILRARRAEGTWPVRRAA